MKKPSDNFGDHNDGGDDGEVEDGDDDGGDEEDEEEIRRMCVCVTRSGICLVWIQVIQQTLNRMLEMTIVKMTMMAMRMMMKLISLLSELN